MALQSIFIILLAVSVILSMALSFYAGLRREVAGALPFMVIMAGVIVWGGAYIFEILFNSIESKLFWNNFQISGSDIVAAGILLFVLVYTGRAKKLQRFWFILLIEPMITLFVVWIKPVENLLRIDPQINSQGMFPVLEFGFGPFKWAITIYVYLIVIISIAILLNHFSRQHHIYRRQLGILLAGALVPLVGSILTIFGWIPIPNMHHLDIAPITLAINSILWAIGLFYYRILDIMPIARQIVFDEMHDPLFVLDFAWRVVDLNLPAQHMMTVQPDQIIGNAITDYLPEIQPHLVLREEVQEKIELGFNISDEEYVFSVNLTPLFDHRQILGGWLLMLMDITEIKRAEEQVRFSREVSETLREAGAVLSATLDFDQILDRLLELVERVIPYDSGCFMLIEGDQARVFRTRGYDKFGEKTHKAISEFKFKINTYPNMQNMYETHQALVIPDRLADNVWVKDNISDHILSWVGAPVIYQDHVRGFFSLEKAQSGFFTQMHAEHLSTFAYQAALALENARLYTEMRIDLKREQRLNEAMHSINRMMDTETILKEILSLSIELTQADRADLGLLTPDGRFLRFNYILNTSGRIEINEDLIPRGNSISWQLFEAAEPVWLNEKEQISNYHVESDETSITSLIGMPLQVGSSRLGVLGLFNYHPERKFTERDLALVESIAHQAGIAIQNSRLFRDIQRMAITDPLTGWYNRRYFFSQAQSEMERSQRYRRPLSIIMLDVDRFKLVNDTHGHLVGDQVLQAITKRMEKNLRKPDLGGRYGGEEFVILLPETGVMAAQQVAERIRVTVADMPIATTKGPVPVTLSLGVASVQGEQDMMIEKLLDMADQALYAAKGAGRNRVGVWRESGIHQILPFTLV